MGVLRGTQVTVHPAELRLLRVVPPPTRFLRPAETGVRNHDHHPPAGDKQPGDAVKHRRKGVNILDRQHARRRRIMTRRQAAEVAGVADLVANVLRAAGAGGVDQFLGRVDARHLHPLPAQAIGRAPLGRRRRRSPFPRPAAPTVARPPAARPRGDIRCPSRQRVDRTTGRPAPNPCAPDQTLWRVYAANCYDVERVGGDSCPPFRHESQ